MPHLVALRPWCQHMNPRGASTTGLPKENPILPSCKVQTNLSGTLLFGPFASARNGMMPGPYTHTGPIPVVPIWGRGKKSSLARQAPRPRRCAPPFPVAPSPVLRSAPCAALLGRFASWAPLSPSATRGESKGERRERDKTTAHGAAGNGGARRRGGLRRESRAIELPPTGTSGLGSSTRRDRFPGGRDWEHILMLESRSQVRKIRLFGKAPRTRSRLVHWRQRDHQRVPARSVAVARSIVPVDPVDTCGFWYPLQCVLATVVKAK
jgi:hypothetical protein